MFFVYAKTTHNQGHTHARAKPRGQIQRGKAQQKFDAAKLKPSVVTTKHTTTPIIEIGVLVEVY